MQTRRSNLRSSQALALGASSALLFLLAVASSPAHAADSSTIQSVVAAPTIHACGVTVTLAGDDDGDAVVELAVRPGGGGGGSWKAAHPLVRRLGSSIHVGSLFYLSPATSYELRVTLVDPDNGAQSEKTATFTTRADAAVAPSGKTVHVSASGGDDKTADGSAGKPYATINAAVAVAQAGDEVRVAAGVYREEISFPRSGTASKPIWLRGEAGAVLDGSDAALAGPPAPTWTLTKDDIYTTPFTGSTTYLAVDDTRIYDYQSLADLEAKRGGQSGKTNVLEGGFFIDGAKQLLYLRLPQGGSPAGKKVYAGVRKVALLIDNKEHIVVQGLEVRYYGGQYAVAVDLRGATRCWIRELNIHHLISGIRSRKGGGENVIERNRVRDTSIYGWPWSSVKAHTGEASAVSVSGGAGDIVRHNTLEGMFNGIYTGEFSSSPDLGKATNVDIYENLILQAGDDGLEPEGACVNQRFWHNVIRGVHNGVSLAPIAEGPLWLLRNVVDGYKANALKLNNGSTGAMLIYHTTAIPGAETGAQAMSPSIPFGGLVARNNIWAGHRYVIEYGQSGLAGVVDLDYDNLYTDNAAGGSRFVKWRGQTYADLAALQSGASLEQNGFSVAPAYVDVSSGDFTLVAGHALLDKAVAIPGINDVQLSGAADVGAFERGGIKPSPGAGGSGPGPGPDGGVGPGPDGGGGPGSDGGGAAGDGAAPSGDGGGAAGDGSVQGDGGGSAGAEDDGCACRAGGSVTGGWPALLGLLMLLVAVARRRRRG
jgi:MYXO-CTERM domain-containing protein